QLLGQPNLHTRSISTTLRHACIVNAPYTSAVGMKGWCRLFRVRGLKIRCTTPIDSKAATVVPLSQFRGRTVTDDVTRTAHVVVRPHSSAGRAPTADRLARVRGAVCALA